jgi:hypothetical protein
MTLGFFCGVGRVMVEHSADRRIASRGAGHRFHHVARERGMKIAEETDGSAVRAVTHQHVRRARFARTLRQHRKAALVECLKILSVQPHIDRIFAGEHCIRWVPAATRMVRAVSVTVSCAPWGPAFFSLRAAA